MKEGEKAAVKLEEKSATHMHMPQTVSEFSGNSPKCKGVQY